MDDTTHRSLGMSEQELREVLSEELGLAFRTEQNTVTIHAIAHSVARVIALDHLRMAEQLEREGIRLPERALESN
jgi:RNA-splicing ligase RtcB